MFISIEIAVYVRNELLYVLSNRMEYHWTFSFYQNTQEIKQIMK